MNESYAPKRSKWIAGILALLIPGTGHMYLGLMIKGIVLMLLLALNITSIVFVSIEGNNVLMVVLLSLMMPIIYFYNLFNALQSTEMINERSAARLWNNQMGVGEKPILNDNPNRVLPLSILIVLVLGGAALAAMVWINLGWTPWFFNSKASMLGAIVLVGAGVGLWVWETRAGSHRNE